MPSSYHCLPRYSPPLICAIAKTNPLLIENAREKIKEVAKAQGFDYVLDSSLGGSVMMAEGKNIEPDVKKALGI